MSLLSAAHYEMIDFFDRHFSHLRLDKESKDQWAKGRIYQSGEVNELFLAFRRGAAYGAATEMQAAA